MAEGGAAGLTFRIVRAADAAGEAPLNVVAGEATIASLNAPGSFVEVVFTGKGWVCVGAGRLG